MLEGTHSYPMDCQLCCCTMTYKNANSVVGTVPVTYQWTANYVVVTLGSFFSSPVISSGPHPSISQLGQF